MTREADLELVCSPWQPKTKESEFVLAGHAMGDVVQIQSDPNSTTNSAATGASLSGSIEYNFTGGSTGQVVFTLTNDSVASLGGCLTGFVFNIDSSDSDASASLTLAGDVDFLDTGVEAANPFGTFDAGAALGADWSGGGNPNRGLAIGSMASFTFSVMASDASGLSAMSFSDMALRFRGFANGGSDKLRLGDDPELNVAPLPSTVLAGGAMLGLGLGVRRLRK